MAYYDAFIAEWNTLPGNQTTSQKLTTINTMTTTGAVPTTLFVTGNQLANCVNWAEFASLSPGNQSNLLSLCAIPGPLLGGSSNTAFLVDGMILTYFGNHSGPTITALTALAQGVVQPWWQANGYPRAFDMGDVADAGVS